MVYEYSESDPCREDSMPLLYQIQVWLHTIICPNCAQEIERYQATRNIMREDFFPPSPDLENAIMAKVKVEDVLPETEESYASVGGLSIRGWVITGFIILLSLATVFFGLDFQKVADETGTSFLLPIGITIGIMLTSYGAFFVGSHLKEFSERFDL